LQPQLSLASRALGEQIADDGVGGAARDQGSGLADRVGALDGTLNRISTSGGGTVVRAEIPCAS